MATQSDMERVLSKIQTSDKCRFTWLVAGKPVVALFPHVGAQECQSLGQPSPHNDESDSLLLWIGLEEEKDDYNDMEEANIGNDDQDDDKCRARKLLVTLSLRIKVGPRKNARRTTRLLFLVIPAESLVLDCADYAYHSLHGNDALDSLLDTPGDAKSAMCRLLNLSMDVDSAQSYAIMPEAQRKSSLTRPVMALVRKFKALSEAPAFNLLANHDDATAASVERVQELLRHGKTTMVTPAIDFVGFYPGGHKAAMDAWVNQGWSEAKEPQDELQDQSSNVHTRDGHTVNALPPYHHVRNQLALKFSSEPHPPFPTSSPPPPAYTPRPKQPTSCTNSPPVVSHSQRLFSSLPPPTPPLPEPSLSPNYTASLLTSPVLHSCKAPTSPDLQVAPFADFGLNLIGVDDGHVHMRRSQIHSDQASRLSRAASEPIQHGAISQPPSAAATSHVHSAILSRTPSSIVLDTPVGKRSASRQRQKGDVNGTKRVASPSDLRPQSSKPIPAPQRNRLDNTMYHAWAIPSGVYLSPTVVDDMSQPNLSSDPDSSPIHIASSLASAPSLDTFPSTAYHVCMIQWLVQAWDLCPSAHYVFVKELLQLGAAAQDDDAEAFHNCRVACTTALLLHCTKKELANAVSGLQSSLTKYTVIDAQSALISWLYILDPTSKMNFFPDLLTLSVVEDQLSGVPHNDQILRNRLFAQHRRQKASIVSNACIRFGKELSKSGSERRDIVLDMAQEKVRRAI